MGLYDGYQLANSHQIKQYEGSVVPELVQVSQEMQKRYDQTQDTNDYTSKFLNSAKTLDSDKAAWQQVQQGYKDKLASMSKRPDLENATREATMLARQLPDDYAPFAENQKRAQTYNESVDKDAQLYMTSGGEKGLSPERAAQYKAASMFLHQKKGGMQQDANGKYVPNFEGIDTVGDLDKNKFVDEAMKGADPQKLGYEVTNINGQWLKKSGNKTTRLTPGEIDNIMTSAFNNSDKWKTFTNSEKLLNGYNKDYSKLKPSDINLDAELSPAQYSKGKNGQSVLSSPATTVHDYLSHQMSKGMSLGDAMHQLNADQIEQQQRSTAMQYAHKYARNDQETSSDLTPNQVWKWNKDDADDKKSNQVMQMANTMVLGGAKVANAKDFSNIQKDTDTEHASALRAYADYIKGINDGHVKGDLPGGGGRIGYKDANGKIIDVTADANSFRSQLSQIKEKKQQLDAVDAAAQRASGFRVTNSMKAIAQKASTEAYNNTMAKRGGAGAAASGGIGEDEAKSDARLAYDDAIKNANPKAYKMYQDELKQRMTGTTIGSDLFTFGNDKQIKNISDNVEGLIRGLGLKNGQIPIQDKDGNQLTSSQYDDIKGDMRAIGVTFTGDPNSPVALVMRAFKDAKGKKTAGEDMIVKLPNTNIQSIMASGMDDNQKSYLSRASGMAVSLNNPTRTFDGKTETGKDFKIKANTDDPRKGWRVQVGDKEETLYSFKDILDFKDANQ